MTRLLPLIGAMSFGLTFLFFNGPEVAQAQTTRTDTIRLLAATRGTNFDGTGLKWCVSQTWHPGYRNSDGSYGPATSLDEVPQTTAGCKSSETEQVEFAAYGLTNDTSCTLTELCPSLRALIASGSTAGQCNFIEARLVDAGKDTFKGRQRMLHASGPSGYVLTLHVTSGVWYASGGNWTTVGTVVNDVNCTTTTGERGFKPNKYHVHQDFMPPTSSENCQWNLNTSTNFATGTTDRRRDDPNVWYLYSLTHVSGITCLDPGPHVADHTLRPGGELDGPVAGTGEGARSLATTGVPITTAPTCFTGTSWCGTETITQPLLQAANKGYRNNVQYGPSSVTGTSDTNYTTWYAEGQYYFHVYQSGTFSASGTALNIGGGCPYNYTQGEPVYWFRVWSSVTVCDFAPVYGWASTSWHGVTQAWSQYRGMGGACPGCPPTQEEANAWTDVEIATGNWETKVKPALDAVIRAAASTEEMAALGITGDPPFDGDLGTGELAGVMNNPNNLVSQITGPAAGNEMNRDWILSSRLRWNPTRKV